MAPSARLPSGLVLPWPRAALATYTPGNGCSDSGGPPSVPDLPSVDDGLKCSAANNQVYTDDKGNQWQIRCGYDYMYYDTTATLMDTMENCMSWCAGQSDYAGVSWSASPPQGQSGCFARSRAGTPRTDAYDSMMLMSPFEIMNLVYGTVDITNYAVKNWQLGNRIEINTNTVAQSIAPSQDRLPGVEKSIFMLYRYGAETRSWVGKQNSGVLTIRPGPVGAGSMLSPDWPSPSTLGSILPGNIYKNIPFPKFITIIDVCYGLSQNRDRVTWLLKLYYLASYSGSTLTIDNALFGDTWPNVKKSAVIWYRDVRAGDDGALYVVTGIEGYAFKLMGPTGKLRKGPLGFPSSSGGRGHRFGRCRLRTVPQHDPALQHDDSYPRGGARQRHRHRPRHHWLPRAVPG